MRQSGDYRDADPLDDATFRTIMADAIDELDVDRARDEVMPFVDDRRSLEIWSRDFFRSLVDQIELV